MCYLIFNVAVVHRAHTLLNTQFVMKQFGKFADFFCADFFLC